MPDSDYDAIEVTPLRQPQYPYKENLTLDQIIANVEHFSDGGWIDQIMGLTMRVGLSYPADMTQNRDLDRQNWATLRNVTVGTVYSGPKSIMSTLQSLITMFDKEWDRIIADDPESDLGFELGLLKDTREKAGSLFVGQIFNFNFKEWLKWNEKSPIDDPKWRKQTIDIVRDLIKMEPQITGWFGMMKTNLKLIQEMS